MNTRRDRRREAWQRWERERDRKKRPARERKRRDVLTLGDALEGYVKETGLDRRLAEGELINRWEELVGSSLASQVKPRSIERGTLVLAVHDSAWRQEMLYMKGDLIRRINGKLGRGVVKEIVLAG